MKQKEPEKDTKVTMQCDFDSKGYSVYEKFWHFIKDYRHNPWSQNNKGQKNGGLNNKPHKSNFVNEQSKTLDDKKTLLMCHRTNKYISHE
jgi:hypothetical protein